MRMRDIARLPVVIATARSSGHTHCVHASISASMAASGTLLQPTPPTPPSSAVVQRLSHHHLNSVDAPTQARPLGDGDSSSDQREISQSTALVASGRRPGSQPATSNCLLPYIDAKSEAQPSPSAITNDFLPQDLLVSLKRQQGRALNPLSPPRGATRLPPRHVGSLSPQAKTAAGGGANILNRPPASVWNYPHRRTRLKHLTEAPPCVCGAGKDISFLYDSTSLEGGEGGERSKTSNSNALPNTLIPEEYHIVKHPGVLGLEFHDE